MKTAQQVSRNRRQAVTRRLARIVSQEPTQARNIRSQRAAMTDAEVEGHIDRLCRRNPYM